MYFTWLHKPVMFDFDPVKDAANIAKHGLSLADLLEFDDAPIIVPDARRDYGEDRFRAFGLIDGQPHSIAFTVRDRLTRLISFRRAHRKEIKRYDPQA